MTEENQELSTSDKAQLNTDLRRNERPSFKNAHPEHPDTIALGLLKSFETELQRKGFLARTERDEFNPLWFLAETEVNVFLWRKGCSIIEKDDFEFWVNAKALIHKRLEQLESGDQGNPFINPYWGISSFDHNSVRGEREYLITFRELLGRVGEHLHALSVFEIKLQEELNRETKESVELPCRKR